MFRDLFRDKRFIFIFTFIVECILYYLFEYTYFTGEYLLVDIGFAPVAGLMFGPVGALGVACASFICEIIQQMDVFGAFMDSFIMVFMGVFAYKLWYTMFDRTKMDIPRFNSIYNLAKFLTLMFIVSIVYLALLEVSYDTYANFASVYPYHSNLDRFAYFLNHFTFSILLGLLLISGFNTLRIPLQTPKRWITKIKIDYKYFAIAFVILTGIFYMNVFTILENTLVNEFSFILMIIITLLFVLNTRDFNVSYKDKNYSIIEQVILIFMAVMAIALFFFVDFFDLVPQMIWGNADASFRLLCIIAVLTIMILVFSIIHIHYVQNIITDPIYGLINSTKRYGETREIENLDSNLYRRSQDDDEVGVLVKSYYTLTANIKDHLNRIQKATAENERFETEFNVASNIQSNMLPKNFDEFSAGRPFEIYSYMNPAKEVGGDFYDFFDNGENNITFVIGDVSGKGIPATLFMVKTMHLIRNHTRFDDDLAEVMENVNDLLCQRNDEELFVTIWIGRLDLESGKLSYVNAGHNPPLIRQKKGDFEYMQGSPDLVSGAIEGIAYNVGEIKLNPGDMVFLYTDGVTEANYDYNGFYGEDRLRDGVNKLKNQKLSEIIGEIKRDIDEFCNNPDQFDDMTMIAIRYDGGNEDD